MIDFIWHLRGSVRLDDLGYKVVALDRVEKLLEKQQKTVSERGSDYLIFNDALWSNPFGPNWLAMVIYDHGRFWIDQDEQSIRYDLRSLHGMLFCLLGALTFFLFGIASGGLLGGIKFAAGIFAWLYGMNVLLAFVRVPRAIHKAVTSD
jgi:hypothetical protein